MKRVDNFNKFLNEKLGLFDTITIKKKDLGKFNGQLDMLNRAWDVFCQRWASENGVRWKSDTDLTTKVARHFDIPDSVKGYSNGAIYLREIGALVLEGEVNESIPSNQAKGLRKELDSAITSAVTRAFDMGRSPSESAENVQELQTMIDLIFQDAVKSVSESNDVDGDSVNESKGPSLSMTCSSDSEEHADSIKDELGRWLGKAGASSVDISIK